MILVFILSLISILMVKKIFYYSNTVHIEAKENCSDLLRTNHFTH